MPCLAGHSMIAGRTRLGTESTLRSLYGKDHSEDGYRNGLAKSGCRGTTCWENVKDIALSLSVRTHPENHLSIISSDHLHLRKAEQSGEDAPVNLLRDSRNLC